MGKTWKVFWVTVITMLLFTACSSETTQKIRSVSEESAVIDFSERIAGNYRVALITDNGDITDRSFNQTTYEACKTFCAENCVDFEYSMYNAPLCVFFYFIKRNVKSQYPPAKKSRPYPFPLPRKGI